MINLCKLKQILDISVSFSLTHYYFDKGLYIYIEPARYNRLYISKYRKLKAIEIGLSILRLEIN